MERMTIIETPVGLTNLPLEEFEEMLGDERLHVKCCRVDRFVCGRRFHPELVWATGDPLDEMCDKCAEVLVAHECWKGHQHCPIPLLGGFVCPDSRA